MNFFKNFWQKIAQSDNQPFTDTINSLNTQISQYKSEISAKNIIIIEMQNHNQDLSTDNDQLRADYLETLANMEEYTQRFENLNHTLNPPNINIKWGAPTYFPAWLIYYSDGTQMQTKSVTMTPAKFYRLWTDEMWNECQAHKKQWSDKEPFKNKVVALRNLVLKHCKYVTDANRVGKPGENWRIPIESYYGGQCDCEDMTSLFITFCNICGIPSDRVFNATGYITIKKQDIGHSFAIFQDDDSKWYVLECTAQQDPKLFKGSAYHCKGMLKGLSNWQWCGDPQEEQW